MKKILFMSDGMWTQSGFGVVMKNIIERLKDKYEIAELSWQYISSKQKINGILRYPVSTHPFGKDTLYYALDDFKPDYVVTLGDYWMCGYLSEKPFQDILKKNNTKWIWYIPIDSDIIPASYAQSGLLKTPDVLVTMSKHGYETAKKYGIESTYIPHGTDTSLYKKMNKEECKKRLDYEDKFVIGCVARNQDRKQLPRLIEAFSIFQKGKPEVILHFHCNVNDSMNLAKDHSSGKLYSLLLQAIYTYGGETKIMFSDNIECTLNGINVYDLCSLYGAMDIHALSTSGEGFGLPILDSMACGIPNVITDYTTANEFIGDNERGLKVPVKARYFGGFGTERALVDVEKFAEALEKLYKNHTLMKEMSEKGIEFTKNYDWDIIIKKWEQLLV